MTRGLPRVSFPARRRCRRPIPLRRPIRLRRPSRRALHTPVMPCAGPPRGARPPRGTHGSRRGHCSRRQTRETTRAAADKSLEMLDACDLLLHQSPTAGYRAWALARPSIPKGEGTRPSGGDAPTRFAGCRMQSCQIAVAVVDINALAVVAPPPHHPHLPGP